jgi:hypothetical protein
MAEDTLSSADVRPKAPNKNPNSNHNYSTGRVHAVVLLSEDPHRQWAGLCKVGGAVHHDGVVPGDPRTVDKEHTLGVGNA